MIINDDHKRRSSFNRLSFQQHTTDLLLSPLQTALPLLIPSLAQDSLLLDLQGRTASLALLHFLLQSPIGGEALRLLLLDQSVLQVSDDNDDDDDDDNDNEEEEDK